MISDREKVLQGLECCISGSCNECPYQPDGLCDNTMMCDALSLLKKQEPVKPIKKLGIVEQFKCGACKWVLGCVTGFPLYCPRCGRKVDWNG